MSNRVRARDLGIKIGRMETGKLNAITDVEGVGVGHVTLIRGEGPLKVGEGPVRTGVTAIVPHSGNLYENKVTAAVDIYNGYGKSVGLEQVVFMGVIETPIMLTDTLNTWIVADAVLDYFGERFGDPPPSLNPVVGETNGGFLNDSYGRHVRKTHVFEAIDKARSSLGRGKVEEGNVGGGTPMTGYGLKGGIGTASRKYANFTVGVLVQLNCGRREDLTIDGVHVGRDLVVPEPRKKMETGNSIMMIVATDLALDSRQLWKVAKRAVLGLARTGSYGGVTSGDYVIAFTTAKRKVEELIEMLPDYKPSWGESYLNPVYEATADAVEEAILNALFKAETMEGINGNIRYALPIDQVKECFKKNGRKLESF